MTSPYQPFSLAEIIPTPQGKQPRCCTTFDSNQFTIGFVDGYISSFERPNNTTPFINSEDSTHKIANGILFGLLQIPEGHQTLTETSLLVGSGDKSLRNVLTDGTELFSITPQTHPAISHTATVENIILAPNDEQTLISAGWDGAVKFWFGDDCMLTLQGKNQYSTQICAINNNLLVIGSASKVLSLVTVDYTGLKEFYQNNLIAIGEKAKNGSNNNDFVSMNDDPITNATTSPSVAMINEQTAISYDLITYSDFKPNAHDHVIRRIIPLYSTLEDAKQRKCMHVATVGNDGALKIWDITESKLNLVLTLEIVRGTNDQSEFLYDIVQNMEYLQLQDNMETTKIIVTVACDDKTLRIIDLTSALTTTPITSKVESNSMKTSDIVKAAYHGEYEIQCLELPTVPRSLATLHTSHDLIVVTPGGVYTMTTNQERFANEEIVQVFNATIQANIEKAKKMSNIDLETLPTVDALLKAGEKDGQYKITNVGGKAMVMQWSENRFEWVTIGEAMGSNNEQGQGNKKEYQGKYYDHVVDVETGGSSRLVLPFNSDDDPYEIAQAFLARNQLDQGALMQVVQFIMPYIDRKKLQRRKEAEELAKQSQLSTLSQSTWSYVTKSNININAIQNALLTRIQNLIIDKTTKLWLTATGTLQTDSMLTHLCQVTQQAPTIQPEILLNENDQQILTTIFTTWPSNLLTPVLDIVRVLACEATANGIFLNPSSKLPINNSTSTKVIFNQHLYDLVQTKLWDTFQTSLVPNEKNDFASLSLILNIIANIIGKRTNHRNIQSHFIMFQYFDMVLNKISTITNANGYTLSKYITTSTSSFGLKLLPALYQVVHNVTCFANRLGLQPVTGISQQDQTNLMNSITTTIKSWVLYLLSILKDVPVGANGIWVKECPVYEFIMDLTRMVCFECDSFVALKEIIITQYKTTLIPTLSNSLQFYTKSLVTNRDDQANCQLYLRDLKILFGAL